MKKIQKFKEKIVLIITSIFLVGLIIGNYYCAKYNTVITTMLCGSGTNFNNEEKENSSSSYEYMKLTYAYDKGEYYLVNVSDLEDYFSRY